jgi:hypothetical protein
MKKASSIYVGRSAAAVVFAFSSFASPAGFDAFALELGEVVGLPIRS